MPIKINCIHNDGFHYCKNKIIKRSLFGIGARFCAEAIGKDCELKVKHVKPRINPPPQSPKTKIATTDTQIIDELRKMNDVLGRLDKCMSDQNHKNQMCIKTGHWND